jgi:hypothetical protein
MRTVLAVTVLVLVGDCGPSVRSHLGESCALLFEARNRFDPKSADIPAINARIHEIGCYMNTSTWTK